MGKGDVLGYGDATVVVTGASSGMGAAVAQILTSLGANVHTVDLHPPAIPAASFHATDLSDPIRIERAAADLQSVGSIDFLFNCAGVPHTAGALACVVINYIGLRHLTELLLPQLSDGAGIASIASDAGIGWMENRATIDQLLAIQDANEARQWCEANPQALRGDGYSFSKEMVIAWISSTAIPLARSRGIRTNGIAPCPTKTALMDATIADIGQDFFDRWPYPLLGRMATAEEQAWPLILLNSRLNNVTTGSVLYTDQGFAAGTVMGNLEQPTVAGGDHRG